jgi:tetratricopeptide (TPR) repeat protein
LEVLVILGNHEKAITFYLQCIEMAQEIGDQRSMGEYLFNLAHTESELGKQAQALCNFQKAQSIFTDLELDHMVEQCKEAIRDLNKIILPSKHQLQDDWWERNLPANDRKATATQQSSSNFWWLFAGGLALALLIYWLKR